MAGIYYFKIIKYPPYIKLHVNKAEMNFIFEYYFQDVLRHNLVFSLRGHVLIYLTV